MFSKKSMLIFIALVPWLTSSVQAVTVDRSVVPLVEYIEQIDHLNPKKYSKEQFSEMNHALSQVSDKIRLVSYNVLLNLHDEKLDPQYRWPARLPRIVALLNELQADIVAVQEPYPEQVVDLREQLKNIYDFYPENCGQRECSGIFIKRSRLEHISDHSIAMTHSSNQHHSARFSLLHLKDKKTGHCFLVSNAHLNFSKVEKRTAQAHYIASKLNPLTKEMPIFFTGDLNTFPQRLELKSLPFYDGDYIDRIFRGAGFEDARSVSILGHLGPLSTFSNNGNSSAAFKGTGTPGVLLDHIYVTPNITVLIHAVQTALVDKLYASDHFPIFIDALIPASTSACSCIIESERPVH